MSFSAAVRASEINRRARGRETASGTYTAAVGSSEENVDRASEKAYRVREKMAGRVTGTGRLFRAGQNASDPATNVASAGV